MVIALAEDVGRLDVRFLQLLKANNDSVLFIALSYRSISEGGTRDSSLL